VPSPVFPLCSVRSSMHPVGNPLWLAAAAAALAAFPARAVPAPSQPEFCDPRIWGGEMLNNGASRALPQLVYLIDTNDAASRHGGEPLNVIISGRSTPSVLTDAGFLDYAGALGLCVPLLSFLSSRAVSTLKLSCSADECLGFHIGDRQPADLGDGHGWVDEGMVLREDFGSAAIGTCWESVVGMSLCFISSRRFCFLPYAPSPLLTLHTGGNHLRYLNPSSPPPHSY
jgi:hypothetical protein